MKERRERPGDSIAFGSYVFDNKAGMLTTRDGTQLFMEHRLRDMFSILLKNEGEFVTKDELMELAWKDTVVSAQSVPKAISDLRKFFVSNRLEDLKIKTIRKLGYRLEVQKSAPSKKSTFGKILPYILVAVVLLVILNTLH